MDVTLDVKFRHYVDKTFTFTENGVTLGTVSFTGTFYWVHFNVAAVVPTYHQ